VVASWDVSVLSSTSEAFPNTLGEAMACGVPCVSTDAGDSARIVGDTGRVVPVRDDDALADAVLAVLSLPQAERAALGLRARARVESEYDIRRVAERYDALYRRLVGDEPARREA
jgi:glycosyltransferase involved in cell wall biosynthesis